ncbi:hypothetical protein [Flagellimonas zhangzhouensis]|uniref:Uncharacterized protein n=1 Tax=Flagellimonas zhangzhouensis TaxID=1073328 RepID=A0A1H2RSN7_9FLAO|nr:hypothetical protein [Allomuricauda zhangzhouensis]SDQ67292.1 hypothetical protein SAMN05216294_2134 [Allomuricauda zhangzhouensis]SDW22317.1 hypothetical protein SAMN04487892_0782 [Allomuricauda zhangzhouensis]
MKKAFKKYSFPLLILLLGGFINLYAYSQTAIDDSDACYVLGYEESNDASTIHHVPSTEDHKHYAETEVEEQEEREEEVSSHDHYLPDSSYLTAYSHTSLVEQFLSESNSDKGYYTSKEIATPTKRHIRFQVFRI